MTTRMRDTPRLMKKPHENEHCHYTVVHTCCQITGASVLRFNGHRWCKRKFEQRIIKVGAYFNDAIPIWYDGLCFTV